MDHGTATEGMECACCYDDIVGGKGGNYVEYRTGEDKPWLPSLFCKGCIEVLIKRQWPIYEETLAKATCKAQQKRMLGEGPPTHVHDKTALKCEEGESVHSLWYVGDDGGEPQVQSALLEGAPQGEARQIWWDEKLAFQFDEDDEEEEGGKPADKAAATASTPPPVPGTASPPPVPPPAAAPSTPATATSQQGEQKSTESEATSTKSPPAAAETAGAADAGAEGAKVQAAATAAALSEMDVEGEASAPAAVASAVPLA